MDTATRSNAKAALETAQHEMKVAEATSMPDAYKQLLPWPGEVAYSKLHTKDVLAALK